MLNIKKFFGMKSVPSLIFSLLIIFSGCSKDESPSGGSGNPGTPGPNEIFITGMAFSPGSKTIAVGTTIKWINKDGIAHTVTSGVPSTPSGVFDSGSFGQNGEFSFTFTQPGTFQYFCGIHTTMRGTIIVQ